MNFIKNKVVLVTILSVAILATLFIAWRGSAQVRQHDNSLQQIVEESNQLIRQLNIVPYTDSPEFRMKLEEAMQSSLADIGSEGQAAGLAKSLHEFLMTRFTPSGGGIERYTQEQLADGWQPMDRSEYNSPGWIEFFEYSIGTKPDPNASSIELIRSLGHAEDTNHNSLATPRGLSLEPGNIAVSIGDYSRANPMWPRPQGWVSEASMVSSGLVASKSHFNHAESLQPQLSDNGTARVAQVQFIAEFGDGSRRPVIINFVWAPTSSVWLIENISVAAIDVEDRDDHIRWVF
jgi:hypothetical protein